MAKVKRNPAKEAEIRNQINRVLLMAQLTASMFRDKAVANILSQVVINFNEDWEQYAEAAWGGKMMNRKIEDLAPMFVEDPKKVNSKKMVAEAKKLAKMLEDK
jgi:hypothetical protein